MVKQYVRVKVFEKAEYVEITEEMFTDYEMFVRHGKYFIVYFECIANRL